LYIFFQIFFKRYKGEKMKVLVTYFSQTGNTEKLARAIYDGIEKKFSKEISPMEDVKNLDDYDLIFCGFPVHSSSVPVKAESFIKRIPKGKNLVFFATHGSLRGGKLAITAFHYCICLVPKAKILGTFGCRGEVQPAIIEKMMNNLEHKSWALEAQSAVGHPDAADLDNAKEFTGWMISNFLHR